MINLKHPKMVMFMPNVTAKDIKLVIDSSTGRTKLFIPGKGEILGRMDRPAAPGVLGNTMLDGLEYLSKTVTSWGDTTSMLVEFSREPKCHSYCSAGIALQINREVERPRFDSADNNRWEDFYTGEVNAPILDDYNRYSLSDLDSMVSQIIEQMKGAFKDLPKKSYLHSTENSPAIARKTYKLEGLEAGDDVIFNVNGTATSVALPSVLPTTAALAYNTNYVIFYLNGNYYITTNADFVYDFTISTEEEAGVVTPMLWVRSNSAYIKLNLHNFEAALKLNLLPIDTTFNASDVLNLGTYEGGAYVTDGIGKFPTLTPDRINERFREWNTCIFPVGDLKLAQAGTKYISYEIGAYTKTPDLHGASHQNGYIQRLEIIVPQTEATTDVWEAIAGGWAVFKDENPTTPKETLDTLLGQFAGTATAYWL